MTQEQPKRTYVKVDALVWERIREEYLGGETARVLEEHYGPSRNTIYNRSRTEGWTKAANPRERPPPAPETMREARSPREAATAAAGQAAHALATGRIRSAAEFARLAEVLARVAERLEPAAETNAEPDPDGGEDVIELLTARLADLRRVRAEGQGESPQ
ncbi:hypothetical protein [Brevundimonas sp.]|uniref:hypothetical protein n=1 Tax=Brevundimonas sp. TaxID=1871086 RepID=UPI0025EA4EC2|nr:hypothetical protein [Brevundimonas sp.]